MKTLEELYAELGNPTIATRKQALAETLALSMSQRLELCALFPITQAMCFAINLGNDVFVLDTWSDAMITFYFQTFNEHIRGLDGQIISLEHSCAEYDGPSPGQDHFQEIVKWGLLDFEWVVHNRSK